MALEAARMVAWEYDPVADRILASDNHSEVYGLVPGIPLQHAADGFALVHPDDVDRHRATVNDAIRRGTAYASSFRITRPATDNSSDRRTRPSDRLADRRTDRLVGTANDVTERKLAEDRVRASEARFRTLFDTMDEGFCIVELIFDDVGRPLDYRFLEVNPAFETHRSQGHCRADGARGCPGFGSVLDRSVWSGCAPGEPRRFIQSARAMAGRSFDVYAFRLGNGGASRRVAILFTDITVRRQAEAEREALLAQLRDQDARKDEFLATLAHELRNPLAPSSTGLQLLEHAGGDAATMGRVLAMMARQLQQLVHLIDDLMDLSRINRGKIVLRRERLALADVLRHAVEVSQPLIEAHGHEARASHSR